MAKVIIPHGAENMVGIRKRPPRVGEAALSKAVLWQRCAYGEQAGFSFSPLGLKWNGTGGTLASLVPSVSPHGIIRSPTPPRPGAGRVQRADAGIVRRGAEDKDRPPALGHQLFGRGGNRVLILKGRAPHGDVGPLLTGNQGEPQIPERIAARPARY